MTSTNRCVSCGAEIPEGTQYCLLCYANAEKQRAWQEMTPKEAVRIIMRYCNERQADKPNGCDGCPIKIVCLNPVPVWEDPQ